MTMDDEIGNIMDEMNATKRKVQKTFHSSFSNYKIFDKKNTFESFDVKSFGAFHGACEVEDSDFGRQVAENRVGVKILEDAHMMVGVHPELRQRVIQGRDVDFDLLTSETGYEVKGKFKNPIMIEADVLYTNALTLEENRSGRWTPADIVSAVIDKLEEGEYIKGFTEEDLDEYYDNDFNISVNGLLMDDLVNEEYQGECFDQEYKEFLFVRDWLESKGYDAIKYKNIFEGDSECIMSFRSENIKVTDSYCLKETFGFNEEPKQESKNTRKNKLK